MKGGRDGGLLRRVLDKPVACAEVDFSSFQIGKGANFLMMSTLAEIEAAVDALSLEQKQELLRFLALRLNGDSRTKDASDLAGFSGALHLAEDPLVWQRRVRGEWG